MPHEAVTLEFSFEVNATATTEFSCLLAYHSKAKEFLTKDSDRTLQQRMPTFLDTKAIQILTIWFRLNLQMRLEYPLDKTSPITPASIAQGCFGS